VGTGLVAPGNPYFQFLAEVQGWLLPGSAKAHPFRKVTLFPNELAIKCSQLDLLDRLMGFA
jgi:hypothetical protein